MSYFGIPIRNGIGIGLRSYVGLESKAPAWTPSVINTSLWLDAADPATITLNGSTVSQWNDKSGNGLNAIQTSAAAQPVFAAGQNLVAYSEQFDQANWIKVQSSVQPNQTIAPDNTLTADKLVDSTVNTAHYTIQGISVTAGQSYTLSVYAKAAERNFIGVQFGGAGFSNEGIAVNLTTGQTLLYNGATIGSATSVGNGWWRINVSAMAIGSSGGPLISVDSALNNQGYAGTGTSGIFLWGAQVNAGTAADVYQKTESSAQTVQAGISGKYTVNFDGINDILKTNSSIGIAGADPRTFAYAYKRTGTSNKSIIQIGGESTLSAFGRDLDSNLLYHWASDLSMSAPAFGTSNIEVLQSTGAVSTGFLNGSQTAQGNFALSTINSKVLIGGREAPEFPTSTNYSAVVFGEIIVTKSVLPNLDRQKLEGYLAWKWGLEANLPANHPYKSIPPTA